jgi:uncharacterized membrane protein YkvA (DUF1232 family)
MNSASFKISFALDEEDVAYFRNRFKQAKRAAREAEPEHILAAAHELVKSVKKTRKVPNFVVTAIASIEDLVEVIEDDHYAAPKTVKNKVLAALAYFADPDDMIPDDIPVLGFLDDAIMIKFVEREFKHELVAFRKFRKFHAGAEQRPWTKVASSRLPGRLADQRDKLRAEVSRREAADEKRGYIGF